MRILTILCIFATLVGSAGGVVHAEGGYVVAASLEDGDAYLQAAEALAAHRKAEIVRFSPGDLDALAKDLTARAPRFVAVVVRPETIDTNFIRAFLLMSTRLDQDPFCDFSYGYITGATPDDALAFVKNIIRAEKEGLPKRLANTFVTTGECLATPDGAPEWLKAAGYEAKTVGFGCEGKRADMTAFLDTHLADLQGMGLIKMTGCGDSERIWLFPDQRNCDPSKHWPYDPAKVGQNPGDEMFWIDAARFRALNLYPAVLTSGTCHSGSLRRVYVEGDIVSTFGTSEKIECYDMPADRSLGLAYIARGVTAAILPVGPNHGWRVDVEARRMFSTGAPIGDVMASCYGELVLAFGGPMRFGQYDTAKGTKADGDITEIMRGGAANRVLYGDPAFAPFPKLDVAPLTLSDPTRQDDGSWRVEMVVVDPAASDFTDQFDPRTYSSRLFAAVRLPEDLAKSGVREVVTGEDGSAVGEVRWAEEETGGHTVLHLLALGGADVYQGGLGSKKGQRLVLRIEPARNASERKRGSGEKLQSSAVSHRATEATVATPQKTFNDRWKYDWNGMTLVGVLAFMEGLLAKTSAEWKNFPLKFELDESATPFGGKRVTMKLDSEPLRVGVERLCQELGLTYVLDEKAGVVRFSRPAGDQSK